MFRLHHIHLLGPDPEVTARWYIEMLGATLVSDSPNHEEGSLEIMLAGVLIRIDDGPKGQFLPSGTTNRYYGLEHFGLETNDLANVLTRAQARNVDVLRPLGPGKEGNNVSDTKADIKGPDELRIEFQQPAFYWEPVGGQHDFSEMLRFHHLHIRATDPWGTARWWANVFGGNIAGEFGDSQTDRIRLTIGGTMINVSGPQPGHPTHPGHPGPHYGLDHFGLETHDINHALDQLRNKSIIPIGRVSQTPDGSKVVTVDGPDQVRVELVQLTNSTTSGSAG